jgi:hypothetical protein
VNNQGTPSRAQQAGNDHLAGFKVVKAKDDATVAILHEVPVIETRILMECLKGGSMHKADGGIT